MSRLKITLIGAGSFVFGPSMLNQIILEQRLCDLELALMDVDEEVLYLMAGVARAMARQSGVDIHVTTHTSRSTALAGADFVISAVAREMQKRFFTDYQLTRQYSPNHLVTEFGGIAGILYSLRQIELVSEITNDMKRLCPDAWFFTVSNPLPRVCQAAHENGIKTVGFCSVSIQVYRILWQLLYGESPDYPFAPPRQQWEIKAAGLNHFTWMLECRNKATGEDIRPMFWDMVEKGATLGNPVSAALFQQTGYLLTPGDDHVRDFLLPNDLTIRSEEIWHGTPNQREARLALLRAVGQGEASADLLLEHPSWERPADLIAALAFGKVAEFHSLNLVNQGQIPNLPNAIFVETPCHANLEGIHPVSCELPATVLPYCQNTATVTHAIVRASAEHSLRWLQQAVEADPTIVNKTAGQQAIKAGLQAHADILPTFH